MGCCLRNAFELIMVKDDLSVNVEKITTVMNVTSSEACGYAPSPPSLDPGGITSCAQYRKN